MPNRAPTLGNSIMQMAMQNRQLNLQANQAFQQGAQQDAMLRYGMLNMLMGDNLSRDQMAEQSSQFNRELGFRQRVHGDTHRLLLDKFDRGIVEFDRSAAQSDRIIDESVAAGTHQRADIDRKHSRNVATENLENSLRFNQLLEQIYGAEGRINQAGRDLEFSHGVPHQDVDFSGKANLLTNIFENSGLGIQTGYANQGREVFSPTSPRPGGQVGGQAGGGGQPISPTATQPVTGRGGMPSLFGTDADRGFMGRLAKPLESEAQGAANWTAFRTGVRSISRYIPGFENKSNFIDRVTSQVQSAEHLDNIKAQKEQRELIDILLKGESTFIDSPGTKERFRELGEEAAEGFMQLGIEAVLNELEPDLAPGEIYSDNSVRIALDRNVPKQYRGAINAGYEMERMRQTLNMVAASGSSNVLQSLDDKRQATAVKLRQILRNYNNNEYKFTSEKRRRDFEYQLESMFETIGQLGDGNLFNPVPQEEPKGEGVSAAEGFARTFGTVVAPAAHLFNR